MINPFIEKVKLSAIITYKKKSGREDQIFTYIMMDEDATHQYLIEYIVNSLMKINNINEDRIIKIDCACYKSFHLFQKYNGNYFRRNDKWFIGYGQKMPNEFVEELI